MQLSEDEFWDLTPRILSIKYTGWLEIHQQQMQQSWEQTRWLATVIVNLQVPKNRSSVSPQKLMKFPWEQSENFEMKKSDVEKLRKDIINRYLKK